MEIKMARPPSKMLNLSGEVFRLDRAPKTYQGRSRAVIDFARRYGSESDTLRLKPVRLSTLEDALVSFEWLKEPDVDKKTGKTLGLPGSYAFLSSIPESDDRRPTTHLAYWKHLVRGDWWAGFMVIEKIAKED